ncbi:hypothetical protein ACJMK2_037299 [Sinanodonta woodiana]|uniref:Uncharacterized protein n=1 Tax=Sinanodonta woodiana TaxID=1069815 RepID=A0ABD3WJV3_SINWO
MHAKRMTDEQIAECREGFRLYSHDKNRVKTSELAALMHTMGQHCTESELKPIVNKLDSKVTNHTYFNHVSKFTNSGMCKL